MKFEHIYRVAMPAVAAAVAAIWMLCGCQRDDGGSASDGNGRPAGTVEFTASLLEPKPVRTRAEDESESEQKSKYITSDPYDLDFFIELNTTDEENVNTPVVKTGTYIVPSGYEGRLVSKKEGEALNWHSLTANHTFYGWTMPWQEDDTPLPEPDDEDEKGRYYDIVFHNSPESPERTDPSDPDSPLKDEGYDKYENNAVYERFIATTAGPYSYSGWGRYVPLEFRHMVSKICVTKIGVVATDGMVDYAIKADMTFIGMPDKARFYPHPAENGKFPFVEAVTDAHNDDDDYEGLTYFIKNAPADGQGDGYDYFYICPELDFSQMGFKINVKNSAYGSHGDYYGSFNNVEFVRENDGSDDDGDVKANDKVLHAGEMMSLVIHLVPGVGPGMSVIIQNWSTEDPQKSVHHTHNGMYTDAEVQEMHDFFAGQTSYPGDPDKIRQLFEMYGQTKEIDGEKQDVFLLYDNVDISKGANANIFPVPPGYIVDGMGHTVTLKSNRGSNNDFGYTQTYFNVGPVRDIWLTDGTNTIYIDREGYVWIYDAVQQDYVNSGNKLPPLVDPEKSYDISCETGTVHKSTYYNNQIAGS